MNGINLNEGNAYNRNTGVFTTPADGVYLFTFAVADFRVHQLFVDLVVNGSIKSSAITDVVTPYKDMQGGNAVILRLVTGDSVWLQIDTVESGDSLDGRDSYRATTFSGVFLYP